MIYCAIGIDFGTKSIGLSASDPTGKLAFPWRSLKASQTLADSITQLLLITRERQPSLFVVGLPLTLSGKDSLLTTKARAFIEQLKQRADPIPVIPWDERLTSAENERLLKGLGVKRKKRQLVADSLAAATILQSYLDVMANRGHQPPSPDLPPELQ